VRCSTRGLQPHSVAAAGRRESWGVNSEAAGASALTAHSSHSKNGAAALCCGMACCVFVCTAVEARQARLAAVVLTTHSIIGGGGRALPADRHCDQRSESLQAVGTAQHLKSKFGFEFEVEGNVITSRISLSDL
jgi:hypothetical protein